mmetsp:Transcript_36606/g.79207  ORF Transcript_36606/g.79207 Transcript_36606/m.79207 type:complete len:117 (+) Transcript_36606:86-436(+)
MSSLTDLLRRNLYGDGHEAIPAKKRSRPIWTQPETDFWFDEPTPSESSNMKEESDCVGFDEHCDSDDDDFADPEAAASDDDSDDEDRTEGANHADAPNCSSPESFPRSERAAAEAS